MIQESKTFIVCCGLGHVNRGYETFTRECFDALKDSSELNLILYKGAGKTEKKEIALWCLKRNGSVAKFLGNLFKKDAYYFEQLSFFLSFIPSVLFKKPDVIFFSDFILGCWLSHFRRILNLKYKLIFSNGAPNGPPFRLFDHVQQLLPVHLEKAIAYGESSSMHSLLPYGVTSTPSLPNKKTEEILLDKQRLKIPADKTILLAVGAINASHKRMDYLVTEVAALNNDNLFVLIVGQTDKESDAIIKKGKELLKDNIKFITANKEEMPALYSLGDIFVLPSLTEGLPRVILEATDYGLPVLVHDGRITKETLGQWAYYANFSKQGELSKLIQQVLATDFKSLKKERHNYIYENFSWDKLKGGYKKMILSQVK